MVSVAGRKPAYVQAVDLEADGNNHLSTCERHHPLLCLLYSQHDGGHALRIQIAMRGRKATLFRSVAQQEWVAKHHLAHCTSRDRKPERACASSATSEGDGYVLAALPGAPCIVARPHKSIVNLASFWLAI